MSDASTLFYDIVYDVRGKVLRNFYARGVERVGHVSPIGHTQTLIVDTSTYLSTAKRHAGPRPLHFWVFPKSGKWRVISCSPVELSPFPACPALVTVT